jgi:glutamate-ammonia-ligase adenylyltransferase
MRRRLLAEFGGRGVWDLKHVHGGLVDIEFIAQGLQILHAGQNPAILDTNTAAALHKLGAAGHLTAPQGERLNRALELYQRLNHIIRLCMSEAFSADRAPQDLKRLVASAAAAPDISAAEALLSDTQAEVRELFEQILGRV